MRPEADEMREAPDEGGTDQKEAEGGGASGQEARLTCPEAEVAGPGAGVTGQEKPED